MEVGTEISQKIRSAIKAKLMEIGSYVDDELPDYIMVMVANKRTQEQMSNDLRLFLGSNTDVFTLWLHGLLIKLQSVSSDSKSEAVKSKSSSKEKKKDKQKKSKDGVESKKEKRKVSKKDGDGDASNPKSAKLSHENEIAQSSKSEKSNKSNHESPPDKGKRPDSEIEKVTKSKGGDSNTEEVEDVRQLLVTETASDELAEELENTEVGIVNSASNQPPKDKLSSAVSQDSVKTSNKTSESREVHDNSAESTTSNNNNAIKRKCPSSVVAAVRRDDGIEDRSPAVASVVKVTSRKLSLPKSMQANR